MFLDFKTFETSMFWGKTGAGVLVFSKDTKRFLISMRGSLVNEPDTYGVIGGRIDNDEVDPSIEALRELKEESGYDGEIQMSLLSVYKVPSFEYSTFLGQIEHEFVPNPDPKHAWENKFFKWVTYDELKKIEPKHFGLKYTLENSADKLENIS